MDETEFPESWFDWDCFNDKREDYKVIAEDDMIRWLKRCMADFPELEWGHANYIENGDKVVSWFDRWFAQFVVSGER